MKNYLDLGFDGIKREIVENIFRDVSYNSEGISQNICEWMLDQPHTIYNKIINDFALLISKYNREIALDVQNNSVNQKVQARIRMASRVISNILRAKTNEFLQFANDDEFKLSYKKPFIKPIDYKFKDLIALDLDADNSNLYGRHEYIKGAIYEYRNINLKSLFIERIFIEYYLSRELKRIIDSPETIEHMGGIYHFMAIYLSKNQFIYLICKNVIRSMAFFITWILPPLAAWALIFNNAFNNNYVLYLLIAILIFYAMFIIGLIARLPVIIRKMFWRLNYGEKIRKAILNINVFIYYLNENKINPNQMKRFLNWLDDSMGPCDPELYNLVEEYSRNNVRRGVVTQGVTDQFSDENAR